MKVGVIGSGSFGITVALLLSENTDVIVYTRSEQKKEKLNLEKKSHGIDLPENISFTVSKQEIGDCSMIFPVVPSSSFRSAIRSFKDFLKPSHILIHATKGLDVQGLKDSELMNVFFDRKMVHTMAGIIKIESSVVRVGCIAGPNLAKEILAGQPAAAVISSEFDEVIELGRKVLSSKRFFTFGSHDLRGTELAGAYKNIIALGSGMLAGMGMGKNMQSILINRGLHEMIKFGKAFGATPNAFLGAAGIGDLIATATSENSRNFTFGKRLAKGETMQEIFSTTTELVEGVRTLRIVRMLATNEKIILPITELLYKIVFEELPMERAISFLMSYSYAEDVDFL